MTTGADQAAWIDEMLAGLTLSRAHVLGLSIGGWLAVQVALHRPEIWPAASHAINGEHPERLAERVHALLGGVHGHRQG